MIMSPPAGPTTSLCPFRTLAVMASAPGSEDGEAIWTESSYKYTAQGLIEQLERAGFTSVAQWIDHDAGFALTLARTI